MEIEEVETPATEPLRTQSDDFEAKVRRLKALIDQNLLTEVAYNQLCVETVQKSI